MKELYTIGLFNDKDVLQDFFEVMNKDTAVFTADYNNRMRKEPGVWKVMKYGRAIVDLSVND